ncbi:OmpA-OmpF porin, OOP family [Yoonia tamlensis]|uniref:OmpA-OmpF porin, OOP family n=1 Tax=Yoonia tamlensis TaxID=390270 RepID=A0A1I6HWT1_9RHOB|nr:OmpA family protein [Yoonia tamlensis]SFR58903.1 OmpA-OmpF porin, OOP family [Yoonia tamlensis]
MRLSAIFIRLVAFAIAGLVCFGAARTTVSEVEQRSVAGVQNTLEIRGYEWATVLGDGLQVIIEGQAPTEAERFRAISAAGAIVDAARVIDNMSVVASRRVVAPTFAIEILRNDSGVSLIGLIPATTDRETLAARIRNIAAGLPVVDLLEVADYPTPDTWRPALNYSLRALQMLPRSKISVDADRVIISAISDSPEEKHRLEVALWRNTPPEIDLTINISAPRPVISPFTVRFGIDEDGPMFDACAADTIEAIGQITNAANAAGFTGQANCTLALGAPSRQWGRAVALSVKSVSDLGGGTVTIADTDITLLAPLGTDPHLFDDIVGTLENNLPAGFAVSAELPVAPEAPPEGSPRFTATRSPEGQVQLRGRIPDDLTNTVAKNFASAMFGQNNITMGTRVVDGLPAGWSMRVLAGIEALSELSNGVVVVEPNMIQIRGNTGNEVASADISRLLIEKLGQTADFDIDVTYVKQLDPIASLPTPEECIAQIQLVTEDRKITFDPSSADISAAAVPLIDDIADILKKCGDLRIRVAGFTDSQGREEMNQQLSQRRADAVLTALRARRVPVSTFESVGFGEENPIADNETEEGREANRRIEFSLILPEPIPEVETTLEAIAEETTLPPTDETAAPADDTPATEPVAQEQEGTQNE